MPREGIAIPDSLNQNLTTNAIHEDVHEIIYDEFVGYVSSAWTGSILHRQSSPANWNNPNVYTLNFSLHGYKIFDSAERYLDTGITVLTGTGDLRAGDKYFAATTVNASIQNLRTIGDFNEYLREHVRGRHVGAGGGTPSFAAALSGSYSGFKYGILNTSSMNTNAVYRFDHFGHARDMLEQRQYGRLIGVRKKDDLDAAEIVNTSAVVMSSSTRNLGANPFLTSSRPYIDRPSLGYAKGELGAPYKT